jgi:hypothetical protein
MTRRILPIVLALLPGMFACAASTPSVDSPPPRDVAIAAVHAHKCGACHVAPEPKSRPREHVEAALVRHKKRVRLRPAEWSAMIDYLTDTPGPTAQQR